MKRFAKKLEKAMLWGYDGQELERGNLMFLDILVVLIIVLAGILGYRKGFVHTLIHTVGWVGAVVLAYLLIPRGTAFAESNTGLYDWLHAVVSRKFDVSLDAISVTTNSLPDSIASMIDEYSTDIIGGIADQTTRIFGTILVFVALFVIIKILLWIILHLFSIDYNDGFTNFADGLFGMLFGFLRGVILVLVILAAMLPLINMMSTGLTEAITNQLAHSHLASYLYNENFLLMLLQSHF